ncbi:MAG: hypothetical protein ACT4OS_05320 [Acidimicrobiales bacterium]
MTDDPVGDGNGIPGGEPGEAPGDLSAGPPPASSRRSRRVPPPPTGPPRLPRPRPRGRALAVTVAGGLAAAGLLFAAMAQITQSRVADEGSATAEFDLGRAEDRARAISRDRTPLLFADPLGRGRDVFVTRVDGEWTAIAARAEGGDGACAVVWNVVAQHFEDCRESVFPPDGEGLTRYPARVGDDGRLRIDLRSPIPPTALNEADSPTEASAESAEPAETAPAPDSSLRSSVDPPVPPGSEPPEPAR